MPDVTPGQPADDARRAQARLTPARRHALEALAANHPRPCRRTSYNTDPAQARVYWQPADWLGRQGLAAFEGIGLEYVKLTDKGVEQALALGLTLDPQPQPVLPAPLQVAASHERVQRTLADRLGDQLAELDADQRQEVFAYALSQVEEDLEAGKTLDLIGCLAEAVTIVHPAYSAGQADAEVAIDPATLPQPEQQPGQQTVIGLEWSSPSGLPGVAIERR